MRSDLNLNRTNPGIFEEKSTWGDTTKSTDFLPFWEATPKHYSSAKHARTQPSALNNLAEVWRPNHRKKLEQKYVFILTKHIFEHIFWKTFFWKFSIFFKIWKFLKIWKFWFSKLWFSKISKTYFQKYFSSRWKNVFAPDIFALDFRKIIQSTRWCSSMLHRWIMFRDCV